MAIESITRVSTDAEGNEGNGWSELPVFSPDGSRIAFQSQASNLVPADTNGVDDIFVKDLRTGAIALVSTNAASVQGNSGSGSPVFSPDGSRITFTSAASNLIPDDTNKAPDIFVKNLDTGAIALVSTNASGVQGNNDSFSPVFSPDGSRIGFGSRASNLVPGDTNNTYDGFVKDLATGAIARVTTAADGTEGNDGSDAPVFSPDGSRIAFQSQATNLVPGDKSYGIDVLVKDLATGAITLVSSDANGVPADSSSQEPVFSPDGGKIAFYSSASNLVPGDTNGVDDIFVKDLATGAIARVSTAADGTQGNSYSYSRPAFSPDGSRIVFGSAASNLVPGDTNNAGGIFVKDLGTGAIERIWTAANAPVFSPDGGQIAFGSLGEIFVVEWSPPPVTWSITPQNVRVNEAAGTVTFTVSRSDPAAAETVYVSTVENQGTTNHGDYVGKLNEPLGFAAGSTVTTVTVEILDDAIPEFDQTFGLTVQKSPNDPATFLSFTTFTIEANDTEELQLPIKSITRISTDAEGNQGDDWSIIPVFSPDGSKVAFSSSASNLVPEDTNYLTDVFVKDLATGAIERVSTAADGTEGNASSSDSGTMMFSPDGSRIAFTSEASNLVPGDTNNASDIFLKNLGTGTVERISTAADGTQGNSGTSYEPVFSPDGSRIAFSSRASNLVPGDTNGAWDIFVKDIETGAITLVSTDAAGIQGNSGSWVSVFSPDGGKIAFSSAASNLVPGDTNNRGDVFVKDLDTGAIERISIAADGTQGNDDSFSPAFSPDGSRIVFASGASNLVPGDTNNVDDIFVKDLVTGAIALVSTDADGVQANSWSQDPVFSPDGGKIVFHSSASNLVAGDTNGEDDIFVKDLATGAIARISTAADGVQGDGSSYFPMFSPDGSRIVFASGASNLVPGGDINGQATDIFMVELDDAWVSPPVVTWSIAPQSVRVNENAGTAEFTVSRSGSTAAQTVYLSTLENQGATNEGDYVGKLNEPVVFAAGEQSKTVSVTIIDDETVAEPDETFGLIVQAAPDNPPTEPLASATFTIEDNDPLEPVNRIVGTARNDRLTGTDGTDIIEGLRRNDWLNGKSGDDVLLGGPGNDYLHGGDGDDVLIGGKNTDALTGGRGADLFVIDALSKIPDTVFDFRPSEGDRLSLGPLIDSLGLRTEPDIDELVGTTRVGKSIAVTLDTNGADVRGGIKGVALLFRPEITDPQQILEYVDTDTPVLGHGDYWS